MQLSSMKRDVKKVDVDVVVVVLNRKGIVISDCSDYNAFSVELVNFTYILSEYSFLENTHYIHY